MKNTFEYMVFDKWVKALSEELGFKSLEPTAEYEIPRDRPQGLDATKFVRRLREKRVSSIYHE
ncbi:MAG: hypothetical protein H5T50_05740 [Nitrososphaeria archaeon]|nr:hypothetical protein [Nitrososphaeria archaeon]